MFVICGPKLSLFGIILSVWGVIQLTFMGLFYYQNSVTLLSDLPLQKYYDKPKRLYEDADRYYLQNSYNCWIAAGIYLITFFISVQQHYSNRRRLLVL